MDAITFPAEMKLTFRVPLVLGVALAAAGAVANAQPSVRIGVDSFAVRFTGAPEARHVFALERADGGFRYREQFALGDMLSRNATVYLSPALTVDSVRRTGVEFGQAVSASADYRAQRAVGRAVLAGQNGPRRVAFDTLLPPGAFDGQALYPMILSKPWTLGETRTLTLFDVDEQSITVQTLRVVAQENLLVPAGRFIALRAELSTTQLPVTIWVSAARPHRLLKVASANGESVLLP